MSGVFLDETKLVLHGCRETKKEVIVDGFDDQQPLIGSVTSFVFSRCLSRKREQELSTSHPETMVDLERARRASAPPRRGGGLVT